MAAWKWENKHGFLNLFIFIKSLLFLYCIYESCISWFLGTLLSKSVLLLLTLMFFLNRSRRCQQKNTGKVAIFISTTYLMCVLSYEGFPLGFKITTSYKTLINSQKSVCRLNTEPSFASCSLLPSLQRWQHPRCWSSNFLAAEVNCTTLTYYSLTYSLYSSL